MKPTIKYVPLGKILRRHYHKSKSIIVSGGSGKKHRINPRIAIKNKVGYEYFIIYHSDFDGYIIRSHSKEFMLACKNLDEVFILLADDGKKILEKLAEHIFTQSL